MSILVGLFAVLASYFGPYSCDLSWGNFSSETACSILASIRALETMLFSLELRVYTAASTKVGVFYTTCY